MRPSATKPAASPGAQKPNSSSCISTNGVKWSYTTAASTSAGASPEVRQS